MKNFNSGKIIQNIILIMLLQLIAFNLHAQYSLFSDVKAKKVGDIITVVLQESSRIVRLLIVEIFLPIPLMPMVA